MSDYTAFKIKKQIEGLESKKEILLHMKRYNCATKIQTRIDKLKTSNI